MRWYDFIYKPGTTPMEKDDGSSQDLQPRICAECGKDCNIDNCYVNANRNKSLCHTYCKDCERLKKGSGGPSTHLPSALVAYWVQGVIREKQN
ncbi:hypothetical protein BGZ93_006558 [Podila epicladia]|nr:hypothetical protein BGZ93_006558 [Podila epicladia]